MSVQCHFLSTNTLQKKFFKLTTLVPIAAEMNLNIKRLQTLTASSVVDCTACGRGEGEKEGLTERRRGFTYTPWAYRDLCLRNLCVLVPWFQEENLCSWIEVVLKISPTLSYGGGVVHVTSQNHLLQGTFSPPQKQRQQNAPLYVAHIANGVASVKYLIISSSLWATWCCLKTTSEEDQCTESEADQNAGRPKCKNTLICEFPFVQQMSSTFSIRGRTSSQIHLQWRILPINTAAEWRGKHTDSSSVVQKTEGGRGGTTRGSWPFVHSDWAEPQWAGALQPHSMHDNMGLFFAD